MKKIIFKKNGDITNFAFYGTLILLGVLAYLIIGTFLASLQERVPIRAQ